GRMVPRSRVDVTKDPARTSPSGGGPPRPVVAPGRQAIAGADATVPFMPERPPYHMTPDELRQWGHRVVDWVADYHAAIEKHRVVPDVKPGDVRSWLPPRPPERPEPFDDVLADLDRVVLPGTTHWQHPGFHAYFPANTSGPAILAD